MSLEEFLTDPVAGAFEEFEGEPAGALDDFEEETTGGEEELGALHPPVLDAGDLGIAYEYVGSGEDIWGADDSYLDFSDIQGGGDEPSDPLYVLGGMTWSDGELDDILPAHGGGDGASDASDSEASGDEVSGGALDAFEHDSDGDSGDSDSGDSDSGESDNGEIKGGVSESIDALLSTWEADVSGGGYAGAAAAREELLTKHMKKSKKAKKTKKDKKRRALEL